MAKQSSLLSKSFLLHVWQSLSKNASILGYENVISATFLQLEAFVQKELIFRLPKGVIDSSTDDVESIKTGQSKKQLMKDIS